MLLKIFYFIFLFSFISSNNKTNWTINSLTKHLKNKFKITDLYYIEDEYNYLTNYEKIILFDGLKQIYENYHYRTFVIIINKVNEEYKNFSNFTLEVINKTLHNNTQKEKDEDRYLIFFYSIEDVKFSYIRGNDTKDIITDKEVSDTIIGMDNILQKKEIFFAVNNLIINILCKHQKMNFRRKIKINWKKVKKYTYYITGILLFYYIFKKEMKKNKID